MRVLMKGSGGAQLPIPIGKFPTGPFPIYVSE